MPFIFYKNAVGGNIRYCPKSNLYIVKAYDGRDAYFYRFADAKIVLAEYA